MSQGGVLGANGGGWATVDLFNPTAEHTLLRQTVRELVRDEVEPQALEHDRDERFNRPAVSAVRGARPARPDRPGRRGRGRAWTRWPP